MEIRDWWTARELDAAAAKYVREELYKRDAEREQRDREFWIASFGGQSVTTPEVEVFTEDEAMARSALRRPLGNEMSEWQTPAN